MDRETAKAQIRALMNVRSAIDNEIMAASFANEPHMLALSRQCDESIAALRQAAKDAGHFAAKPAPHEAYTKGQIIPVDHSAAT